MPRDDRDDDLDISIGRQEGREPEIPSYLTQAILVTLCCCQLFGIVAIVFAAQVSSPQGFRPGEALVHNRICRWAYCQSSDWSVCDSLGDATGALLTRVATSYTCFLLHHQRAVGAHGWSWLPSRRWYCRPPPRCSTPIRPVRVRSIRPVFFTL